MNQHQEELLSFVAAYRRGELSPAKAHEVATALEDAEFAEEASREEAVQEALSALPEDPLPRGLIRASVTRAVGQDAPGSWFSLDTLLVALGVGILCAAVAQLVASRVSLPAISEMLASLATFTGFATTGVLVVAGVAWLGMMALLALGAWLVYRALRS